MVVILAASGLALDMGHYYTVNQQLKNAADAGALAGVRAIFPINYTSVDYYSLTTPRCASATDVARTTAQSNRADALSPTIVNVQIGRWDVSNKTFTPSCSSDPTNYPNAVTITTQRENVALSFMQVLGFRPYTLRATSTAILGGVSELRRGHSFPVTIGRSYVKTGPLKIYLNDDISDHGGWCVKAPGVVSEKVVSDYLRDCGPGGPVVAEPDVITVTDSSSSSSSSDSSTSSSTTEMDHPVYSSTYVPFPPLKIGDSVHVNNGVFNGVLNKLNSCWINKVVWIPVVESVKFNQYHDVIGFTAYRITGTGQEQGKAYLDGEALFTCYAAPNFASGGGPDLGLITSPKLIQ